MAQNLELRHLCQKKKMGDRWINSLKKMRFLSFLSIQFCLQSVLKHSVVRFQGIAMNLFEDLTAI